MPALAHRLFWAPATVEAGGIAMKMALSRRTKRAASVISGTHAKLIKVDGPTFREMVKPTPDFALMSVMARRLRVMNQRYRPQAATW
jgi:hypothetical protein